MHQIRFSLGLCPRPRWGSLTCLFLGLLNITYLLIYLTGALWLAVVGFLPRVSHDEAAVSTAVGQKSPPAGALDDSRAVRFGAQIPMITELGWLTSFIAYVYTLTFLQSLIIVIIAPLIAVHTIRYGNRV